MFVLFTRELFVVILLFAITFNTVRELLCA